MILRRTKGYTIRLTDTRLEKHSKPNPMPTIYPLTVRYECVYLMDLRAARRLREAVLLYREFYGGRDVTVRIPQGRRTVGCETFTKTQWAKIIKALKSLPRTK